MARRGNGKYISICVYTYILLYKSGDFNLRFWGQGLRRGRWIPLLPLPKKQNLGDREANEEDEIKEYLAAAAMRNQFVARRS